MPVEAFRRQILDPIRAAPTVQEAKFAQLMNWWKAVSCLDDAGTCPLIASTLVPGPLDMAFRAWYSHDSDIILPDSVQWITTHGP